MILLSYIYDSLYRRFPIPPVFTSPQEWLYWGGRLHCGVHHALLCLDEPCGAVLGTGVQFSVDHSELYQMVTLKSGSEL